MDNAHGQDRLKAIVKDALKGVADLRGDERDEALEAAVECFRELVLTDCLQLVRTPGANSEREMLKETVWEWHRALRQALSQSDLELVIDGIRLTAEKYRAILRQPAAERGMGTIEMLRNARELCARVTK